MSALDKQPEELLIGEFNPVKFVRTVSGASTTDLGSQHEDGHYCFSKGGSPLLGPSPNGLSPGEGDGGLMGEFVLRVDSPTGFSDDAGDSAFEPKVKSDGHDQQTFGRSKYGGNVDSLLDSLSEVKALWKAKYTTDFDDEEDSSDEEEYTHDEEGTPWMRVCAVDATQQRNAYVARVSSLEKAVEEVKALFKEKTGNDADEDDFVDDDGTLWVRVEGEAACRQQEAYQMRLFDLEASLGEAKALYASKTGDHPDVEDVVDADGMLWSRVEAKPAAAQHEEYQQRLASLCETCREVKALFQAKTGEVVSDDEEFLDEDGTLWVRTVGGSCD